MRISQHAIERLEERYNIKGTEVGYIANLLSNPDKYEVLSINQGREIREVSYNHLRIQGVIRNGIIATCVPANHIQNEDGESTTVERRQIKHYKKQIEVMEKKRAGLIKELEKLKKIITDKNIDHKKKESGQAKRNNILFNAMEDILCQSLLKGIIQYIKIRKIVGKDLAIAMKEKRIDHFEVNKWGNKL